MAATFPFVGTFGLGQARSGKFVTFQAADETAANAAMRSVYGEHWSMARRVTEDDPDPAGIDRWGLVEIGFGE